MLCTVKVRRSPDMHGDDLPYCLQITAKHAVGGAGGLLSDETSYASAADLLDALNQLKLPVDTLSAAGLALEAEDAERRWIPIGTGLQITFEDLTANGFHLEDESD